MAPIDWSAISRLVPEAVIVIIFMIYSERRDKNWQEFLRQEREERHREGDALTAGLSAVATLSSATNHLITTHDAWERQVASQRRATDD